MSQTRSAKDIFADAIELPEGERGAFVERECGGDTALRGEVRQLLELHAGAGNFLTPPVMAVMAPGVAAAEGPGTSIGRYKLLEAIGEGGFGTVFMAEQEEPVRRRVALKIIKLGMDTRQIIARFEQERQALALMDHPHIAKVLDAGATLAGRPYFVMELVKGDPITAFCDKNNLTIRERLALMGQVCEAVQHAHQKGIIHRDLKPSNVLVSMQDGRPLAKVIDFGIAKATEQRLTEKTVFTEFRQLIGTPEYMSPEQAGGTLDIDTRTDVYSLGVLLYELLTGSTPFDPKRLRSAAFGELQRIIREVDPPKPSTRLSQAGETLPAVAASRRVEPGRLGSIIRGELDWIVMKALDKDRGRRYDSPSALGADLERYLGGEAVQAAPPSARYRLRKALRRNRAPVVAGSLVLGALLVGLGAALYEARIAARERDAARTSAAAATAAKDEAEQRQHELELVSKFQESQLKDIDVALMGKRLREGVLAEAQASMARAHLPEAEIGPRREQLAALLKDANFTNVALQSLDENIFDRTLKAIEEKFKDQPRIKAGLLLTIGQTMENLGLFERATAPIQEGLAIDRKELGDNARATAVAFQLMGSVLRRRGKLEEAEPYYRSAVASIRAAVGPEHLETLTALNSLGLILQARGNSAEAESCFREVLDTARRVLPAGSPDLIQFINNMGFFCYSKARFAEAEAYFREAADRYTAAEGPDSPSTLTARNNLGSVLKVQGKYADAEAILRDVLERRRRILGDEHLDTLRSMGNFAAILEAEGKLSEAAPFDADALRISRRTLGPDHPNTLIALHNVGTVMLGLNRDQEAEEAYREAFGRRTSTLGPDHEHTLLSACGLAASVQKRGRPAEAEQLYRDAIPRLEKTVGKDHWLYGQARAGLGSALSTLGQYQEAEAALLDGERVLGTKKGASAGRYEQCLRDLVALYAAWDRAEPGKGRDKSAVWQEKLDKLGSPGGPAK